jgi:hypothetical protein
MGLRSQKQRDVEVAAGSMREKLVPKDFTAADVKQKAFIGHADLTHLF